MVAVGRDCALHEERDSLYFCSINYWNICFYGSNVEFIESEKMKNLMYIPMKINNVI